MAEFTGLMRLFDVAYFALWRQALLQPSIDADLDVV